MRAEGNWYDELNAGKESVACDLKAEPGLGRALFARADVVLDTFRPGVADRLGLEPGPRTVWCSLTGFGTGNRHEQRAGHDLNYLGWAGVLESAVPPTMIADYTGAFAAVRDVLAGLLERDGPARRQDHRLDDARVAPPHLHAASSRSGRAATGSTRPPTDAS